VVRLLLDKGAAVDAKDDDDGSDAAVVGCS
jgi:hypothetical protein